MYAIYDLLFYQECLEEMAAEVIDHELVDFLVGKLLKIQKYADELERLVSEIEWEGEDGSNYIRNYLNRISRRLFAAGYSFRKNQPSY